MHKNFGEWYRLVSIEPDEDLLKKRWVGVEEWTTAIRGDDDANLETVRIFQGLPEKVSREGFLGAFRKHDAAFPQRNELEQRVLAGAVLVECVLAAKDEDGTESEADVVRAAVIAGTALEASRLRASDARLQEVTAEVLVGLHKIARRQRKRSGFNPVVLGSTTEEAITKAVEQVINAGDHNALRAPVGAGFQAILKVLRSCGTALEGAAHDLRCSDEETNILWWIEGRSSRDLKQSWISLKDAVPLAAAWELADLTDVALGPQDASAFLERVLSETKGKGKEQPIEVYVNAVSDDWVKTHAARIEERALDLTPLSLALSQRAKSNTKSWQQYFEANSGLKASTSLAPERFARSAYIEAVLFRTLADSEA